MSHDPTPAEKVRLDKWLWAARFFKSRSLAKAAIEGGKVHLDGQRVKVSKEITVGCELCIRQGWDEKTVVVTQLSEQRRGAPAAYPVPDRSRTLSANALALARHELMPRPESHDVRERGEDRDGEKNQDHVVRKHPRSQRIGRLPHAANAKPEQSQFRDEQKQCDDQAVRDGRHGGYFAGVS